jgi:hypothetical protein
MQLSSSSGVIVGMRRRRLCVELRPDTALHGGYKPKQGDRVHFEKYAGKEIIGDDGVKYQSLR